jgi:hypothetical protein
MAKVRAIVATHIRIPIWSSCRSVFQAAPIVAALPKIGHPTISARFCLGCRHCFLVHFSSTFLLTSLIQRTLRRFELLISPNFPNAGQNRSHDCHVTNSFSPLHFICQCACFTPDRSIFYSDFDLLDDNDKLITSGTPTHRTRMGTESTERNDCSGHIVGDALYIVEIKSGSIPYHNCLLL